MAKIDPCLCPACATTYLIQQHALARRDAGSLICPKCGAVLVKWNGNLFYTLAVDPPKSHADIPLIDPSHDPS